MACDSDENCDPDGLPPDPEDTLDPDPDEVLAPDPDGVLVPDPEDVLVPDPEDVLVPDPDDVLVSRSAWATTTTAADSVPHSLRHRSPPNSCAAAPTPS